MKYILVKREPLFQEIWDNQNEKLVISFTEKDFNVVLTPLFPEMLCKALNKDKSLDKYDMHELIVGFCNLALKKDESHNELINAVEGLKAGGQALNFVIPPPVTDFKDCVTTSELYKTQYSLAKKQWSAYYSRFYEKKPNNLDYMVQHVHRHDLHSISSVDGKWFMRVTRDGRSKRIFVGTSEEKAKSKRDEIIENLKNNE